MAIVARNKERLTTAAKSLSDAGIKAQGFACDLSDANAVKKMIAEVQGALGPIDVVHWNVYTPGAGDLLTASAQELSVTLGAAVHGLVAAVQASHADLKAKKGAVLVTGGGFAFYDAGVDAAATQWKAQGLAIAKAAQHKTVGLLSKSLEGDGVYVGEVVVTGMVKGTAFDSGNATLDPNDIAEKFWSLYQERKTTSVTF